MSDRLISGGTGLRGMIATDDNPYRYEALIRRDTPKKPVRKKNNYINVCCSVCGEKILKAGLTKQKFCHECGQRLDWGE